MRSLIVLAIAVSAILFLAACGAEPAPTPTRPAATPTPAPTATPTTGATDAGRVTFLSTGCAACHGAQGWGTRSGPPLAGVSVDEVIETVRNGEPPMPRFGPETISDAQLTVLATYVNSIQVPTLAAELREHLEETMEHTESMHRDDVILHLQEAHKVGSAELGETLWFLHYEAEKGEFEPLEEFTGMLLGEAHP